MSRPAFAVVLWVVVAIAFAVLILGDLKRVGRRDTGDFQHFYFAAVACLHHQDPYLSWTRGYIYPPVLAYVYQLPGMLPRDTSARVMLAVNATVTLVTLAMLTTEFFRRFGRKPSAAMVAGAVLLALFLDIDKVKGEWQMWQTDVWMLLMFAIGLKFLDRRPWLAGLALAAGANVKYLPLLFLPWLLLRRRWALSGWLLLFTAMIAITPALQVGWHENAREWGVALGGLTHLAGSNDVTAAGQTEIHGLADALSCSVTSAFARGFSGRSSPVLAYVFAIATAAAFTLAGMSIYQLQRLPLWVWPKTRMLRGELSQPWLAVTAIEYAVLIALVLAFSPQTNTRHLYDVLMLTSAAAVVLIVAGPKVSRWPLIIGCVVLVAGFTLPPGHRATSHKGDAEAMWLHAGGPCWCLLGMSLTLLWTGLSAAPRERALPENTQM